MAKVDLVKLNMLRQIEPYARGGEFDDGHVVWLGMEFISLGARAVAGPAPATR